MYDLIIQDATIVSPEGRRVADIAVEAGKIVYVGARPGGRARERVSASGRFVIPGLVDTHVHFRSPGHPQKEDWASGSAAAASGGVTTVLDMPNTSPPTLRREDFAEKARLAAAASVVDFGIWVGASSTNFDGMRDLMEHGDACGIKVFMGASTGPLLVDDATLERVFRETTGLIGVHAEDERMLEARREAFRSQAAPDHNAVRPPEAAARAVQRLVDLSRAWPRQVHVCHVSSAVELAILEAAGETSITTEACPHHLWLSTDDQLGNFMKCNPPVRAEEDRRALWAAIRRQRITTIGSDHAPHTREEKERPYWEAPSGIPGVETTLPVLLAAVRLGRMTIEQVVQLCCLAPADRFGLNQKGRIEVGRDADLVLFAERDLVKLEPEHLLTRVGWSPFLGQKLGAKPEQVYVRGRLVAQRGQVLDPTPWGRLQRPAK